MVNSLLHHPWATGEVCEATRGIQLFLRSTPGLHRPLRDPFAPSQPRTGEGVLNRSLLGHRIYRVRGESRSRERHVGVRVPSRLCRHRVLEDPQDLGFGEAGFLHVSLLGPRNPQFQPEPFPHLMSLWPRTVAPSGREDPSARNASCQQTHQGTGSRSEGIERRPVKQGLGSDPNI